MPTRSIRGEPGSEQFEADYRDALSGNGDGRQGDGKVRWGHLFLNVSAGIALILIVVGLIVGIAAPGKSAGIVFPIGVTMWFLVGVVARRIDGRSPIGG